MNKVLYFYFYIFPNYKKNRAVQIHLSCLKYYSAIFNRAHFFIALDDTEDNELISSFEIEIIKSGFKNITFEIVRNSLRRESECHNKMLDLLNPGEISLWGHSKGITNYDNAEDHILAYPESIDIWLLGLWFLNCEYIQEMEMDMIGTSPYACFYGGFLMEKPIPHYSGGWYWINNSRLLDTMTNKPLPIDRDDGETFQYRLNIGIQQQHGMMSHDYKYLFGLDMYKNADEAIQFYLNENELKEFNNFKNKIISNIDI